MTNSICAHGLPLILFPIITLNRVGEPASYAIPPAGQSAQDVRRVAEGFKRENPGTIARIALGAYVKDAEEASAYHSVACVRPNDLDVAIFTLPTGEIFRYDEGRIRFIESITCSVCERALGIYVRDQHSAPERGKDSA